MIRRFRFRRRPLSCHAVGKLLHSYLDGEAPEDPDQLKRLRSFADELTTAP